MKAIPSEAVLTVSRVIASKVYDKAERFSCIQDPQSGYYVKYQVHHLGSTVWIDGLEAATIEELEILPDGTWILAEFPESFGVVHRKLTEGGQVANL